MKKIIAISLLTLAISSHAYASRTFYCPAPTGDSNGYLTLPAQGSWLWLNGRNGNADQVPANNNGGKWQTISLSYDAQNHVIIQCDVSSYGYQKPVGDKGTTTCTLNGQTLSATSPINVTQGDPSNSQIQNPKNFPIVCNP